MEFLKQFWVILFGYKIKVLIYHQNLVYAATLSEPQRMMCWRLILEEFGYNIHHIYGVDNILSDTLSILPSTPSDKYNLCISEDQCRANELFAHGRIENNKNSSLLILLIVNIEQQKELRNIYYKLSTYISDQVSGYYIQALCDVKKT